MLALSMGSSPRVRGAVSAQAYASDDLGIIPARAGSSLAPRNLPCQARDHPRACGEQALRPMMLPPGSGSSPRVRGAVEVDAAGYQRPGIIPARAGSSQDWPYATPRFQDHPRACGEQPFELFAWELFAGSSPRVRGAAIACWPSWPAAGIIPARAGSRASQ